VSDEIRLAGSVIPPKTRTPHSITFEVSEVLLEQSHWRSLTMESDEAWSPPVQFRFMRHDYDDGWDLVMRKVDP